MFTHRINHCQNPLTMKLIDIINKNTAYSFFADLPGRAMLIFAPNKEPMTNPAAKIAATATFKCPA